MRGSQLTGPHGNNTFAYEKRKQIESDPGLRIPKYKEIKTIQEITLGALPTFSEIDEQGAVKIYTGLEYIYEYTTANNITTYLFDNHNYALYFWAKQKQNDLLHKPKQGSPKSGFPAQVIHIDQHSDLGPTPKGIPIPNFKTCSDEALFNYTVKACNVGNFIKPALESGIIGSCNRIKNQYSLEKLMDVCNASQQTAIRLDIDLDFWAPGMGTDLEKTIPLVRRLMREASLITIATSPYFLDQSYAITLLEQLFYDKHSG